MKKAFWTLVGIALGITGTMLLHRPTQTALAFNDRAKDYIMSTGQVTLGVNQVADGIWILDYRAGKLLGAVVNRFTGQVSAWSEVDLVREFGIAPKQDVHFMMTTGAMIGGQTALYLTEINTGRFAVYTMMPPPNGQGSMIIRKHGASAYRPQTP
jgi:hypothetical protein